MTKRHDNLFVYDDDDDDDECKRPKDRLSRAVSM